MSYTFELLPETSFKADFQPAYFRIAIPQSGPAAESLQGFELLNSSLRFVTKPNGTSVYLGAIELQAPQPCVINAEQALAEFEQFLLEFEGSHGREMVISDNAPQTLEELKAMPEDKMVIWSGASDTTIYSSPYVNYLYRYHHDYGHLEYDFGMTGGQELLLWEAQASLYASKLSTQAMAIVFAEHVGQVLFYLSTGGQFPADQQAFLVSWLSGLGFYFEPGSMPKHWKVGC